MKAIQVEKLLKGLIDNFCDELDNDAIIDIIKTRSYITGGCIPSMLLGEYVNDFDFYFYNEDDIKIIKKYYENNSPNYDKKYHVKLITENSVNLSDKIQFVLKYYGRPENVISNFDWQHIKSHYSYRDGLQLTDDIYRLIVEKDLIYTGSEYPLSSLLRTRKFIKKGWNVSTKTMVNIALDIVDKIKYIEPITFIDLDTKLECKGNFISKKSDTIEEPIFSDCDERRLSVDDVIQQLNGVDPLTIQIELAKHTGEFLTINQIINLL